MPFAENENIMKIHSSLNMFVADTLEDILDFVDPGFIMYVEPDFVMYLNPMSAVESPTPAFMPFAYATVNDLRFREQWNLDLIRGPAAWTTTPTVSTSGVTVAVIDSGIYRNHD